MEEKFLVLFLLGFVLVSGCVSEQVDQTKF